MFNYYLSHDELIAALMSYSWRDENDFSIDDADEKRKYIEGWLPNIPTADVAPVIHAYWKSVNHGDAWACSNCGRVVDGRQAYIANYCWDCGAKMDEEINE